MRTHPRFRFLTVEDEIGPNCIAMMLDTIAQSISTAPITSKKSSRVGGVCPESFIVYMISGQRFCLQFCHTTKPSQVSFFAVVIALIKHQFSRYRPHPSHYYRRVYDNKNVQQEERHGDGTLRSSLKSSVVPIHTLQECKCVFNHHY